MPHADHFLTRLDRVSPREVELALDLYNDATLVAAVLAVANVPGDSDRVAVALGAGDAPPHLVVTRAGRFVTCLAAGMRVRGIGVISYPTLTETARTLDRLRGALQRLEKVDAQGGGVTRILTRLGAAGPYLSRARARQPRRRCASDQRKEALAVLHVVVQQANDRSLVQPGFAQRSAPTTGTSTKPCAAQP